MEKYYKYNQGKRKKIFLKVSEEIPDVWKNLKKSFISFKEAYITDSKFGLTMVSISSGLSDIDQMNKTLQIYKAEEISEEEYLDALFKIDCIKQEIDRIFKEL